MKPTVTVIYTITYVVSFAENYGFTACKKCFNIKTGRELKQVYKNGSIGYNIARKFYTINTLRESLRLTVDQKKPF